MFNVMIIDDDAPIRARLKKNIDWEALSLRLACEAADSDTAWELYLTHRPKIVITDINIPIISGLELAEQLQKEDPDIRFIVITGYNDFEFVRRSVNLGAVDLISKPVSREAIHKSLIRAIDYFEKKQKEQMALSHLQHLIGANLPVLQQSFMSSLLREAPKNPASLRQRMSYLKIDCPGPYYAVVLVAIQSDSSEIDEAIAMLVLQTLSGELKSDGFSHFSWLDSHFRLNCVISSPIPKPDNLIEERLAKTREQIKFTTGRQIRAGIGPTVDSAALLYRSRSGALTALNYQGMLGDETVTHFKNLEQMNTVFHSRESIYTQLLQMFRNNDSSALESAIRGYVKALSALGGKKDWYLRRFFFEYVISITNESLRLGVDVAHIDSYASVIGRLFQALTTEEYMADVLTLTDQLLFRLFSHYPANSNHLVAMAEKYIQENLSDNSLCLDKVSDYIGLSRIYFCKLFHQTKGISFNNFLKEKRIKLAKHLLLTTNMKVYEVSFATGFSNAKYFSYVFRQSVGLTPVEYQNQGKD